MAPTHYGIPQDSILVHPLTHKCVFQLNLHNCLANIKHRMSDNFLQFNDTKSEVILIAHVRVQIDNHLLGSLASN